MGILEACWREPAGALWDRFQIFKKDGFSGVEGTCWAGGEFFLDFARYKWKGFNFESICLDVGTGSM